MTRDRLMSLLLQLALPAAGTVYFVLWCIAETGRGQGPAMMPPPEWAVFAGFGTAIGLAGRFPRAASLIAMTTLAMMTFLPVMRLEGSVWAALLAVPIVGVAVASAPRRRIWAAAYAVIVVVLVDTWLVLAGMQEGFLIPAADFWAAAMYTLLNPFAIATALVMAAAWAIGWALGTVRTRYAERRAAARQAAELREAELELAAALEHERFAREVHDVVAHSLAGIVAQADGARYAGVERGAANDALDAIAERGRGALVEVRRLLDGLDDAGEFESPGIDRLDELVAGARSAGLDVEVDERGEAFELASPQSRALYRIIQESLTNAVRHGGRTASTTVVLDRRRDGTGFEIVSPRRAERVGGVQGRGIVGMRERARLAGGWLGVDADDERGFVVAGFLPAAHAGGASEGGHASPGVDAATSSEAEA
ncbi:sensor histidine kinase [Agromyces lapidis]|uniref:histidine kinase n=1 Tax=Agromyces lapidis TaxID=279574 RepID=A0ABV5SQ38_9MICO|nr:histidine kinase [Agromyces lapidis]